MSTFGIDCGHTLTGDDYGAVGVKAESNLTREVGTRVISKLKALGHTVINCYKDSCSSVGDSLSYRTNTANNNNVDIFISIHFNCFNSSAHGTEVFTYGGKEIPQARNILNNIVALGYTNRGLKDGSNLYVLKHTKMKAMLIECCFCDSSSDMTKYNAENMANAIVKGLVGQTVIGSSSTGKTSIMGKSVLDAESLAQHVLKNNPNPKINCSIKELANYFIEEGNVENIRGDIAFCQAIKETGYFKYGGDVLPEQNNYCGLGTTGGGVKGAYFKTPRDGVRAQIQHLKAYGSKDSLNGTCIDPRFNLVSRGIAPNWEALNGKWAVPGIGYGEDILKIYSNAGGNSTSIQRSLPSIESQPLQSDRGKSELIRRLQQEINKQGFGEISVDGIAGINTLSSSPTCKRGARGNITKIIQEMLINMGYINFLKPWGADGVFGQGTEDAIKQFQKTYGLSSDGIIGRNTWRKFFEKLN